MRVFLSYSLNDKDQYVLTLLASELKKRGFMLNQSHDFNTGMSSLTKVNISKSQLFIGLITGKGSETKRVQSEWRLAKVAGIQSILLVENTVKINKNFNFAYIVFDRHNPQTAINELNNRINLLKKTEQNTDALAFVLGGAALLAIIGLLSNND